MSSTAVQKPKLGEPAPEGMPVKSRLQSLRLLDLDRIGQAHVGDTA
jgi:hypothetical protein